MKFSRDLWVIAALLVFTVVMAFWASLYQPICFSDRPSLWEITPWSIKLALFQMGAALLLTMLTLSRRFIAPVPYTADETRVRGEYLSSMAQLFQKAKASYVALDLLSAQFRRDLSKLLGLAPATPSETLVQILKTQRPDLAPKIQEIFREESEARTSPNEARVLKVTQKMAALRKEWSILS
ncbi:hypothetical protein HY230_08630 [Candidatus Acetothermia bacterium]|nr:hypothetical protein [Candidatus Acetothermia bacterium]